MPECGSAALKKWEKEEVGEVKEEGPGITNSQYPVPVAVRRKRERGCTSDRAAPKSIIWRRQPDSNR